MIKKTLLTCAALLAVAAGAQGQIQKQVDVTRAYEPSVADFSKLSLSPNLTDTTSLRPEFTYNIAPHPLSYTFGTSPIRPASFNTVDSRQLSPLYLKAGLGAPLQSIFDFYATKAFDRGHLSASVNHYGQWADIKNDMEVEEPGTLTFNTANVWGDMPVSRRLTLGANAGYDYTKLNRYGHYQYGSILYDDTFDPDDQGQHFSTFRGGISFGTDFIDPDRFNFRITGDVSDLSDRFDYGQTRLDARLEAVKNFGPLGFEAGVGYTWIDGRQPQEPIFNAPEKFKNGILEAEAAFLYDNGTTRFKVGADFHIEDYSLEEDKHPHFFPVFSFEREFFYGRLIPFLEVNEELIHNDYASLAVRNPYVIQGANAPSSHRYNGRIGLKGRLSPSVRYKVFGGYSKVREMVMHICYTLIGDMNNTSWQMIFFPLQDDANLWTAGAEIGANIMNAVEVNGKLRYFNYKMDNLAYAYDCPKVTAEAGIRYNYREKLYLGVTGTLMGSRYGAYAANVNDFSYLTENKLNAAFDLRVNADYFITRQVGVFAEAGNILNQKLYPFNHYPGLGVNFMAGVKLSF